MQARIEISFSGWYALSQAKYQVSSWQQQQQWKKWIFGWHMGAIGVAYLHKQALILDAISHHDDLLHAAEKWQLPVKIKGLQLLEFLIVAVLQIANWATT